MISTKVFLADRFVLFGFSTYLKPVDQLRDVHSTVCKTHTANNLIQTTRDKLLFIRNRLYRYYLSVASPLVLSRLHAMYRRVQNYRQSTHQQRRSTPSVFANRKCTLSGSVCCQYNRPIELVILGFESVVPQIKYQYTCTRPHKLFTPNRSSDDNSYAETSRLLCCYRMVVRILKDTTLTAFLMTLSYVNVKGRPKVRNWDFNLSKASKQKRTSVNPLVTILIAFFLNLDSSAFEGWWN
jgi:hypothetical protein